MRYRALPQLAARGQVLLLVSALLLAVFAFAGLWLPSLTWFCFFLCAVLAVAFVIDIAPLYRLGDKAVLIRQCPSRICVKTPTQVSLSCAMALPDWLWLDLTDSLPNGSHSDGLPVRLSARALADAGSTINYTLIADDRGIYAFGQPMVRCYGRLLLTCRYGDGQADGVQSIEVLPKLAKLSGKLPSQGKQSLQALLVKNTKGVGQTYHQLRDYMQGDSLRRVAWHASSRLGRLLSKEYEATKEQTLLFLVDASLQMRHKQGDQSHLDEVLGAMLLLAQVALAQGDAVGFVSFSGKNDTVFVPKKGNKVLYELLQKSANIQASMLVPDYQQAAATARTLLTKPSVVILLTSTRTSEHEELLLALKRLSGHQVFVANLYEEGLLATPTNAQEARTYHSSFEHLSAQGRLNHALSSLPFVKAHHTTPKHLVQVLLAYYR